MAAREFQSRGVESKTLVWSCSHPARASAPMVTIPANLPLCQAIQLARCPLKLAGQETQAPSPDLVSITDQMMAQPECDPWSIDTRPHVIYLRALLYRLLRINDGMFWFLFYKWTLSQEGQGLTTPRVRVCLMLAPCMSLCSNIFRKLWGHPRSRGGKFQKRAERLEH